MKIWFYECISDGCGWIYLRENGNDKKWNPCVRPECGMKYLPIHIQWEWEKWKSECLSWTDLTVTCCLRVVYVSQCLTRPQGLSSNLTSSVTHTPVSPVIDVTDDIQIVITFGISKTKHYWQYFVRLVIGRALTFIFIFKGFEINAICVRKRLVMEM